MRCHTTQPLYGTTKFVCQCGGLYDVEHDFGIRPADVPRLKQVFRARALQGKDVKTRSRVWGFKEFIMPSLDDSEIISLGEGVYSLQPAGHSVVKWVGGHLNLWIIPEGQTQTGSFKDHGGTVAVSVAHAFGIQTIACASTGDTSAMAAAYAAAAGMDCVVVLPQGQVTNVQIAQLHAHGARIIMVPGSFDDCMKIVKELAAMGHVFPINSINPARIEGHMSTVFMTAQFLGWRLPDAFAVPLGNGSNTSSIGKGIRTLQDLGFVDKESVCKIIATQSEASNPLATSWQKCQVDGMVNAAEWLEQFHPQTKLGQTVATAARIGDPVSYEKVVREICASRGVVLTAAEQELIEATKVLGASGFSGCPQTGQALAGLRRAVKDGYIRPGATVFLVSTATSLKFPDVATSFGGSLVQTSSSTETSAVAKLIGV
ncbi:MAG: hypothetical protein JWP09_124 [Candidatus Taylorbacteria bacterium]|nr:hypothetical protein [Candidatus Taylorbacteria bacterium]